MSTFVLEMLEGRELFAAGFTTASLTGYWEGTSVISDGGSKYTYSPTISIVALSKTQIEVYGYGLWTQDNDHSGDNYFNGSVNKKTGAFKFTEMLNFDSEEVILKGKVAKNDEGQIIMQFTETDEFWVVPNSGPSYFEVDTYHDILTQIFTLPLPPPVLVPPATT